jgi:hypothetical protein
MAIKITIYKQKVACDKQKTALVCFWSVKYHTHAFLGLGSAFLGLGKCFSWPGKGTRVIFSLQKHTRAVFLLDHKRSNTTCTLNWPKIWTNLKLSVSGNPKLLSSLNSQYVKIPQYHTHQLYFWSTGNWQSALIQNFQTLMMFSSIHISNNDVYF